MSDRIAKEKRVRWRLSLTIESRRMNLGSLSLTIVSEFKCDLCRGVTFRSIIQVATSIEQHWIGLTAGENFKLKSMRCRPCISDPRIRNIAIKTNHLVNKSYQLHIYKYDHRHLNFDTDYGAQGTATATAALVSGFRKSVRGSEGKSEGVKFHAIPTTRKW